MFACSNMLKNSANSMGYILFFTLLYINSCQDYITYPFPSISQTVFTISDQSKASGSFSSHFLSSCRFWSVKSEAMIQGKDSQADRSWWMVGPLPMSIRTFPWIPPAMEANFKLQIRQTVGQINRCVYHNTILEQQCYLSVA